jgi:hypothetical protein
MLAIPKQVTIRALGLMKVLFIEISCLVQRCVARWIKAPDSESEILSIDNLMRAKGRRAMLQKLTSSLFVPPKRNRSENSGSDFVTSISRTGIPRPYWFVGFAAVFLLSCFVLLFIILNGANVPFGDEFAFTGLAQAMRLGQVSFAALWAPHNEQTAIMMNAARHSWLLAPDSAVSKQT